MKKSKIAKLKVYKDFSTGVSVTLFAGGLANFLLMRDTSNQSLIFSLINLLFSWVFLQSAVEYELKLKT